jgi:hypothetical protein
VSSGKRLWLVVALAGSLCGCVADRRNAHLATREYYIDSNSPSQGGDGTREKPWQTLGPLRALVLHPGDSVNFASGSHFQGGFAVNQSGTATAPVTIKPYGSGAAPRFANPDSAVLNGNAIRINGSHVIVDGFFFENCPINPVATDIHLLGAVFLTTNANHCIVRNCEMTKTPLGITVYGQHNLVTRNYIHDNNQPIQPHWGPICVVVCGSHNEISYNRFVNYSAPSHEYGHDGGAIEIHDRSLPKEDIVIHHNLSLKNQGFTEFVGKVKQDNFLIHHNVCMDYQSFLGLTGPCTNFRIEHNTVLRTLAHPEDDSEDVIFWNYGANTNINLRNNIFVYDPSRVEPIFARGEFRHDHNLFYRTDHAELLKAANQDAYQRKYLGGGAHLHAGDKIGDPLFHDFAKSDFHLTAASPARGAGTNLNYKIAFDGQSIPSDTAPSMGAFEYRPE